MSDEVKGLGETPEQSAGGAEQEASPRVSDVNDTVKYDTYKRTLSEAKKFKTALQETQERLQVLEQEKLQAEGKTQELLQSVTAERDKYKSQLAEAHGAFANGRAMDVIVDEANKMGVQSTGLLRKMVGDKIKELEFDDEYRPNPEQVKMILEDVRKEEPLLFSKPGPRVADHNLNASYKDTGRKSLNKMTEEELNDQWSRLENRRR